MSDTLPQQEPPITTPNKVFISYTHDDAVLVAKLLDDLEKNNIQAWIDTKGLEPGTPDWEEAIRTAISTASCVLLIASPESRRSTYVRDELQLADFFEKRTIPLWISGNSWIDSIPLGRGYLQYIDCRDHRYRSGLNTLLEVLGADSDISLQTLPGAKGLSGLDKARNRRHLLRRVEDYWINGVLIPSLYRGIIVQKTMQEDLALVNAFKIQVKYSHILPGDASVAHLFDRYDHSILIGGHAGSGKTTTLLELARDKIELAKLDPTEPIPVVFLLSNWTNSDSTFDEWLVNELFTSYEVPRNMGFEWISNDGLLLLLDGLDEIADKQLQAACVNAINEFRRERNQTIQIAVTTRLAEYEQLDAHLKLGGAICLLPLTDEQIYDYLKQFGEKFQVFIGILEKDHSLLELFRSPLMLSTLASTYYDASPEEAEQLAMLSHHQQGQEGYSKKISDLIFQKYVRKMLGDPHEHGAESAEQNYHYLRWLAQKMQENGLVEFRIEQIQPQWLDKRSERVAYAIIFRLPPLILGLSFVAALGGLIGGILPGLLGGVVFGFVGAFIGIEMEKMPRGNRLQGFYEAFSLGSEVDIGLRSAMIAAIFGGILSGIIGVFWISTQNAQADEIIRFVCSAAMIGALIAGMLSASIVAITNEEEVIRTVERIRFSWEGIFTNLWKAKYVISLFVISIFTIGWWLENSVLFGMTMAFFAFTFLSLVLGIAGSLKGEANEISNEVSQGIKQSARYAVQGALISGLALGVIAFGALFLAAEPMTAFALSIFIALISGAGFALGYGGAAYVKHFSLRFVLVMAGYIPWDFEAFLDQMVRKIILQRIGSGYRFIHTMLLEYFAAYSFDDHREDRGDGS